MLARILVPLDGSALAERALPVAARLARASGGELLLLRVYQALPSEFTPELVVGSDTGDVREARAYLAHIGERADLSGVPVERITLGGAVARAILNTAAAYEADCVVMTSHGRSGFTRQALGSVAEYVARHATMPALVLREEEIAAPFEASVAGAVWRAYIALDGSDLSVSALEPAARLLRALAGDGPAEARLLTVTWPFKSEDATYARERNQRLTQASALLRAGAARLETGDLAQYAVRARWAILESADEAEAIARAAERPERVHWSLDGEREGEAAAPDAGEGTRFIALAERAGVPRRRAEGRVTARVLERSPLPLLIVPV